MKEDVSYRSSSRQTHERAHRHGIPLINALQLDLHLGNHVLAPPLLVPTSKSIAEDVKGIMEPSTLALLLLESFLAEAVVNLALLRVREGFVGVADL